VPRKLENWLDGYLATTSYSNSPRIYRLWAAITTIGATMQRRNYIVIQGERLFPNFYTVLVGPPGVGKTRALRPCKALLANLPNFTLAPSALTKEKLIDNLTKSGKVYAGPDGMPAVETAYACFLDELSTFIKHKDYDFMTNLTDMFDCPAVWEYETIGRGSQRVENLFLTIAGGITPKSIQTNWGEAAIGMGFTARLNMVYSEEITPIDIFAQTEEPDWSSLQHDLQQINETAGRFNITREAGEYLRKWIIEGMPPIPADSRFSEYNPRRSIHWLKLCMVYSIAESDSHVITLPQVERAKETLLEAEQLLPLAFEQIGQNPLLGAINALHRWMKIEYTMRREPLHESRLRRKLLSDVPPQYVDTVLQELISSKLAKLVISQSGKMYIPEITRMGLDE